MSTLERKPMQQKQKIFVKTNQTFLSSYANISFCHLWDNFETNLTKIVGKSHYVLTIVTKFCPPSSIVFRLKNIIFCQFHWRLDTFKERTVTFFTLTFSSPCLYFGFLLFSLMESQKQVII